MIAVKIVLVRFCGQRTIIWEHLSSNPQAPVPGTKRCMKLPGNISKLCEDSITDDLWRRRRRWLQGPNVVTGRQRQWVQKRVLVFGLLILHIRIKWVDDGLLIWQNLAASMEPTKHVISNIKKLSCWPVAVIAECTAYDLRYSYRVVVVSMSIYLLTISNWSLLLLPVNFLVFCD